MDLKHIFVSALARRVAFVVVAALLAWAGIGKASAQSCSDSGTNCATIAAGFARCEAYVAEWNSKPLGPPPRYNVTHLPCKYEGYGIYFGVPTVNSKSDQDPNNRVFWIVPVANECTAPEWNDPSNPGQCLSFEKCLERNASSEGPRLSASESACIGGCTYAFKGIRIATTVNSTGKSMFNGTMGYTGGQCGATPPPTEQPLQAPPPPDQVQECVPAGDGQTMCVKKNGEHCFTATTGKQICWGGAETGEKGDADLLQKRNAGPTKTDPPAVLPSGDTLIQKNAPVTTTTQTKDANGNVTRTTTTTTTNYTTTNGTNAPNQQGQPGTGTGTPGEGEGDDDKGSASGGGTCAAAPTCSGDPIMCAQLQQQWLARCDLEKARNDIGTQVDAMSTTMGTEDVEVGDVVKSDGGNGEDLSGSLDLGGYGFGNSCPAPPEIFGTALDLGGFCDVMTLLGLLVAAMGILHAFYIIQGA